MQKELLTFHSKKMYPNVTAPPQGERCLLTNSTCSQQPLQSPHGTRGVQATIKTKKC
jgi:hypothetical protein